MFRSTLEMVPNGVMLIDVHSYAIRFANQEMHRILKGQNMQKSLISLQDQVAKFMQFEDYQPQNDDHCTKNHLSGGGDNEGINLLQYLKNACSQLNVSGSESIFKRKADGKMYLQLKCQFTSNLEQLLVVCTDITRLKHVEKQEKKMRASFFSSVAHELRTPLNSIIPIINLMTQILVNTSDGGGTNKSERVQKLLRIVRNSSLHLQSVIEDALDISRLENNKFQIFKECFAIRQVVAEVSDIMSFQMEQKGITQIVQVSANVPPIICSDCKRFKQVLFNIIGNAVKFTYQGHIKITVEAIENRLVCQVEDTGIGIQMNDQQQLFKFFGTITKTKDLNRGGMGLGLTISKMILQEMGGDISVKSEQGVGSAFTFSLPLEHTCSAQPQVAEQQEQPPSAEGPPTRQVMRRISLLDCRHHNNMESSKVNVKMSERPNYLLDEENLVLTDASPEQKFVRMIQQPSSVSLMFGHQLVEERQAEFKDLKNNGILKQTKN
ncbi:hypothetical protein FGO68_gene15916 [Halteria grandinella]|uniref:histidine kinase n=1 Tax=Halteria grandinella TaxID=5974 RepID=A0A8J8NYX9_HALGN|nr:hypothetical protein FGO68_gene15916 [Halteria grandinella]